MARDVFATRLQRLREREGIKRHVLDDLCGLARGSVRKYERMEAEPTLSSIIALAEHFGVSLDYLVGRQQQWHPTIDNQGRR